MNAKNKSYPADYHTKSRPAVKTMHLQVAVAEPDLKNAVLAAFDLAKSGGRELNLDFNLPSLTQNIPKPYRIGATQRVSSRAGD